MVSPIVEKKHKNQAFQQDFIPFIWKTLSKDFYPWTFLVN